MENPIKEVYPLFKKRVPGPLEEAEIISDIYIKQLTLD
jgi:hypothetical protein